MPVRLVKPYMDQAANTLWWGAQQSDLIANGIADTRLELASDYQDSGRIVTTSTASTSHNAMVYLMNSASPQTLTISPSGYWPVGSVLSVVQRGAGAFTIAGAAGVSIVTASSSLVSKGQHNIAQLLKVDANSWVAFGGIGG